PSGRLCQSPLSSPVEKNAMSGRPSTRGKIMNAAIQLARQVGPGHISLDAVARQAGVSKGGLLYHFPSKTKLLEALVSYHLDTFEKALARKETEIGGGAGSVIAACLNIFEEELKEAPPPAS